MSNKIKNFIVKIFSLLLAIFLSIPSQAFAGSLSLYKSANKLAYDENSSIMGVLGTDISSDNDEEIEPDVTIDNKSIDMASLNILESKDIKEETDDLIITKKAILDKSNAKIDRTIEVEDKNKLSEDDEHTPNIKGIFAINKDTGIYDIKVQKIETLSSDGELTETSFDENISDNDDIISTAIVLESKSQKIIYHLSSKVNEEIIKTLNNKEEKLSKEIFALDLFIEKDMNINYAERFALTPLSSEELTEQSKEVNIDPNGDIKAADLYALKPLSTPDSINLYNGIFEDDKSEIYWSDLIAPYSVSNFGEQRNIEITLSLDENQDATNSEINIEYYEPTDKGYILKEEFTQNVPYAETMSLEIPNGYLAKLEFSTKIDKNNTKVERYSLNNREVKNPYFKKEETKEGEDPLPQGAPKEEKPEIKIDEPKENKTADKEDTTRDDSNVKTEEQKENPDSNSEQLTSAIDLNKEATIKLYEDDNKLTENLDKAIDEIAENLKLYNEEKINYEELLEKLKENIDIYEISKDDFVLIFENLISGLKVNKYKVAEINPSDLSKELYKNIEDENRKKEEKTDEKQLDEEPTKDLTETPKDKNAEDVKDDDKKVVEENKEESTPSDKKDEEEDEKLKQTNPTLFDSVRNMFRSAIRAISPQQINIKGSFIINKDADKGEITQKGETHILELSPYLTSKNPRPESKEEVKSLKTSAGTIIATGIYDPKDNTVTYTITDEIDKLPDLTKEEISFDENFVIDNTMAKAGESIILRNSFDGIAYEPEEVEVAGDDNTINTFALRDAAIQAVGDPLGTYQVAINAKATPLYTAEKLTSINREIIFDGRSTLPRDKTLKDIGLNINFSAVQTSGINNITGVILNGTNIDNKLTKNPQNDGFLLNDSKNYTADLASQIYTFTFNTPITTIQDSYALDLTSLIGSGEGQSRSSQRIIVNDTGKRSLDKPIVTTFVGNTTIYGEYKSINTARRVITDNVTADSFNAQNGTTLPLALRQLSNNQTVESVYATYYRLNASTGKMEQVGNKTKISYPINPGDFPQGIQPVGTIATYEINTTLNQPGTSQVYSLDGAVLPSIYGRIDYEANWSKLDRAYPIPDYTITLMNGNKEVATTNVSGVAGNVTTASFDNIPLYQLDNNGNFIRINYSITQNLPSPTTHQVTPTESEVVSYVENSRNVVDTKHIFYNSFSIRKQSDTEPRANGTFTITKVDQANVNTKISGVTFNLVEQGSVGQAKSYNTTTDQNGQATFSNIPPGKYLLSETVVPQNYTKKEERSLVTIANNGFVSRTNELIATESPKAPATQYDYNIENNRKAPVPTANTNETATSKNLQTYSYAVLTNRETGTLDYYILVIRRNESSSNTTEATRWDTVLNIDTRNTTITGIQIADVNNNQRASIINAMNNKTVDGTTYDSLQKASLTDAQGRNIVINNSSNLSSNIVFDDRRFGDSTNGWAFLVKVSTKIPENNLTNSSSLSYNRNVRRNTARQTSSSVDVPIIRKERFVAQGPGAFTITNTKKPNVEFDLTKLAEDNKPLANATFTLYNSVNKVVQQSITSSNGVISFKDIPVGTYTLKETEAPKGYYLSDIVYTLIIDDDRNINLTARDANGNIVDTDVTVGYNPNEDVPGNKIVRYLGTPAITINPDKNNDNILQMRNLEGLGFHANLLVVNVNAGDSFNIDFQDDLNFQLGARTPPDIKADTGEVIATPSFNRDTNVLTYTFTNDSYLKEHRLINVDLTILGILPDQTKIFNNVSNYKFDYTLNSFGKSDTRSNNINIQYTGGTSSPSTTGPDINIAPIKIEQRADGKYYLQIVSQYNASAITKANSAGNFGRMYFNYGTEDYPEELMQLREVSVYEVQPKSTTTDNRYALPGSAGIDPGKGIIPPTALPTDYKLIGQLTGLNKTTSATNGVINYNPSRAFIAGSQGPLQVDVRNSGGNRAGDVIVMYFEITNENLLFSGDRRYFTLISTDLIDMSQSMGVLKNKATAVSVKDDYKAYNINYYNKRYTPGEFRLIKVNSTDSAQKLVNAEFTLYDQAGGIVSRQVTNSVGELLMYDLKPGVYTLKETRAPDGFKLNEIAETITVNPNGTVNWTNKGLITQAPGLATEEVRTYSDPITTSTDTVRHPTYPQFMNLKQYARVPNTTQANPLVEYYVMLNYDSNGNVNKNTNVDISSTNIDITNVEMYDINPNQRAGVLSAMDNGTVPTEVINPKLNLIGAKHSYPITGKQTASSANIYIPQQRFGSDGNWKFLVRVIGQIKDPTVASSFNLDWTNTSDSTSLKSLKTNINPTLIVTPAQPAGIDSPEFTIGNVPIIKGAFRIYKTNSSTRAVLQGAKFRLTPVGGTPIEKVSDTTGYINFTDLLPGDYTLEEIEAPDGFIKRDDIWNVNVNNTNGEVKISGPGSPLFSQTNPRLDIGNTPTLKRSFKIRKLNAEDESLLTGASFRLIGITNDTDITLSSTSANPISEFSFNDLGPGRYLLTEQRSPDGFKTENRERTVDIADNGDITIIEGYIGGGNAPPKSINSQIQINTQNLITDNGAAPFDQNSKATASYTINTGLGVRAGDRFTVRYFSLKPVSESYLSNIDNYKPVITTSTGEILATGVYYPERDSVIYTFTKEVEKARNRDISVTEELSRDDVSTNGQYNLGFQIGNNDPKTYLMPINMDGLPSMPLVRSATATPTDGKLIDNIEGDLITLVNDGNNNFEITNLPNDGMVINLKKTDSSTNETIVNGSLSLLMEEVSTPTDGSVKKSQTFTIDLSTGEVHELTIPTDWDGEFRITEVSAPAGYIKLTEPIIVNIDQANRTITTGSGANQITLYSESGNNGTPAIELLNISNEPAISVNITKVSLANTEMELPGAKFALYESWDSETPIKNPKNPTEDYIVTTNNAGLATFDLQNNKTYYLKEIEAPTGYIMGDFIVKLEVKNNIVTASKVDKDGNPVTGYRLVTIDTNNEKTIKLEIANDQGNVRIQKVDENKRPLRGAKFRLYARPSGDHADYTNPFDDTGANGTDLKVSADGTVHTLGALNAPGYYFIREIEAPEGYELPNYQWIVHVEVDETNYYKVPLNPLYENDGKYITDPNRLYKVGINRDPAPHIVTPYIQRERSEMPEDENDPTKQYKVPDGKGGFVYGYRPYDDVDAVSGPTIKPSDLSMFVKNASDVEGIWKDPSPTAIDVPVNPEGIAVSNYTPQNEIQITKVDNLNPDKKLEGVVFGLFQDKNASITLDIEATTDENGIAIFNNLESGTYYLKEIKTVEGYKVSDDIIRLVVDKSGKIEVFSETSSENSLGDITYEVTNPEDIPDVDGNGVFTVKFNFNNNKKLSAFRVIKYDEEGNIIPNTEFRLLDDNKNPVTNSYSTNENGELFFYNIPDGTYYLEEVSPAGDYKIIPEENFKKIVIENGNIVQFTRETVVVNPTKDSFNGVEKDTFKLDGRDGVFTLPIDVSKFDDGIYVFKKNTEEGERAYEIEVKVEGGKIIKITDSGTLGYKEPDAPPVDQTNKIKLTSQYEIRNSLGATGNNDEIHPSDGEYIRVINNFDFSKGGYKSGDTFTVSISNNINPRASLSRIVDTNGRVIANAKLSSDGNSIIYTFTNAIEDTNVKSGTSTSDYVIDTQIVSQSENITISQLLADMGLTADLNVIYNLPPVDITDTVKMTGSIKVQSVDGVYDVNRNDSLEITSNYTIPEDAKGGDHFTVKLSDNLIPTTNTPVITLGNVIIANGVVNPDNSTTYTLTDEVKNLSNRVIGNTLTYKLDTSGITYSTNVDVSQSLNSDVISANINVRNVRDLTANMDLSGTITVNGNPNLTNIRPDDNDTVVINSIYKNVNGLNAKPGDYFTVTFSNNIIPGNANPSLMDGLNKVAEGNIVGNTITYTFIREFNGNELNNTLSYSMNRNIVTESGPITVRESLKDSFIEKVLNVDYSIPPKDVTNIINITAAITNPTGSPLVVKPNEDGYLTVRNTITTADIKNINPGDTFSIKFNENILPKTNSILLKSADVVVGTGEVVGNTINYTFNNRINTVSSNTLYSDIDYNIRTSVANKTGDYPIIETFNNNILNQNVRVDYTTTEKYKYNVSSIVNPSGSGNIIRTNNTIADATTTIRELTPNPDGVATDYEVTTTLKGRSYKSDVTTDGEKIDVVIMVENGTLANSGTIAAANIGIENVRKALAAKGSQARISLITYDATKVITKQALTAANALTSTNLTVANSGDSGTTVKINDAFVEANRVLAASTAKNKIAIFVASGAANTAGQLRDASTTSITNLQPTTNNYVYGYVYSTGVGVANYFSSAGGNRLVNETAKLSYGSTTWSDSTNNNTSFGKVIARINQIPGSTTTTVTNPYVTNGILTLKLNDSFQIIQGYSNQMTIGTLGEGDTRTFTTRVRLTDTTVGTKPVIDNITLDGGTATLSPNPSIEIEEKEGVRTIDPGPTTIIGALDNTKTNLLSILGNLLFQTSYAAEEGDLEVRDIGIKVSTTGLDDNNKEISYEDEDTYSVVNASYKSSIKIKKTNEDGEDLNYLKGAEFALFDDPTNLDVSSAIRVGTTGDTGNVDEAYHHIVFEDLKNGTYYLREIKAPNGYIKMNTIRQIVVESNNISIEEYNSSPTNNTMDMWAVEEDESNEDILTIRVKNKTPVYPGTGGPGTYPILIMGVLIMSIGILFFALNEKYKFKFKKLI